MSLYGGFAGTETARDQRYPAGNVTVLSGDIDNNDSQTPIITNTTTVTGNTTNSYHVVSSATGAILDGFTITAGNANGASVPSDVGGGMSNYNGSPTLTNVTFSGNTATYNGGGMSNNQGNPTLTNVTFSRNSAINGGGMFDFYGSPILTNVTFSGNSAINAGGGMFDNGSPTLTNVTFSDNSAAVFGGGMANYYNSPQIRNTIVWGNTATSYGAQISDDSSTPSVSYSVVQDGYAGTNIITGDPLLGALGNYGGFTQTMPLQAGSSAIDTGNDAVCPATDQRGVSRPQGAHCDIGAYEVDTTAPIVSSIIRLDPSPTAAASVNFAVTFSESVVGVDTTDFTLNTTGVSGASVGTVTGSGTTWTVPVNTGIGNGTIRLDVPASATVTDLAGNPLVSLPYTSGETYTITKVFTIFLPLILR